MNSGSGILREGRPSVEKQGDTAEAVPPCACDDRHFFSIAC